ncbi:hypothetical protein D3C87_1424110 [compost metagenome]
MTGVALKVGEGFIKFATRSNRLQFAGQTGGDQLAVIEHQAVFELLGLFHVRGGDQ